MIRAVCFALLVVAVSCKPHGAGNCCPPDKYEGLMGVIGGYSVSGTDQALQGYGPIAVDRSGMKIAFTMDGAAGPTTFSVKAVQDFKQKVQYLADLKNKTCVKTPLNQPFYNGCVPDTMRPMATLYYGIGADTLNTVSYMGTLIISEGEFNATMSVTKQDCIPVGQTIFGKANNMGFSITYGFMNNTEGIKDMSVFDPPPYCKQAKNLEQSSHTVFKL